MPPQQGIDYERLAREAREEARAVTVAQPSAAELQKDVEWYAKRGAFHPGATKADEARAARAKAEIDRRLKPSEQLPGAFPRTTNADAAQWTASGASPAHLYPIGSPERKQIEDIDQHGNKDLGKAWLGTMAGLAGGEAVAAGSAATQVPRVIQGLMRIGGNAAVGGGIAAAEGGDWRTGAAAGGVMQGAGEGLTAVAPYIAEGAMRITGPIARKFGRIGELGDTVIANRIRAGSQAGADQAAELGMLEGAYKEKYLRESQAGNPVPIPPIKDRAAASLRPHQDLTWEAGLNPAEKVTEPEIIQLFGERAPKQDYYTPRPIGPVTGGQAGELIGPHDVVGDTRLGGRQYGQHGGTEPNVVGPYQKFEYVKTKGPGETPAHRLDAQKGTLDIEADSYHRAAEQGTPGAAERAKVASALSSEIGQELGVRAPEYPGYNKRIMNLKGVELASQSRADIPGRQLETMKATYEPSARAAFWRFLRAPQIMGRSALAVNDIGVLLSNPATRAAVLQMLLGVGNDGLPPKKPGIPQRK